MKIPADGWDRDEQEALDELEAPLEQVRERHRADLPVELLRAARAQVLPTELQESVARHIEEDDWSRALVDGLSGGDCALDSNDEARLFARIQGAAGERRPVRPFRGWLSRPALGAIAASLVIIILAGVLIWRSRSLPPEETGPAPVVATAPPAPSFHLPLEAPGVKLSVAVLTWRGADEKNHLLAELKPGLDAFRNGDYKTADEELSKLAGRYPESFDVRYYQGLSRLLGSDPRGAIESLTAARRTADASFSPPVAWYLAVAYERAGRMSEAREELAFVCRTGAAHASEACGALQQIQ